MIERNGRRVRILDPELQMRRTGFVDRYGEIETAWLRAGAATTAPVRWRSVRLDDEERHALIFDVVRVEDGVGPETLVYHDDILQPGELERAELDLLGGCPSRCSVTASTNTSSRRREQDMRREFDMHPVVDRGHALAQRDRLQQQRVGVARDGTGCQKKQAYGASQHCLMVSRRSHERRAG
ncbi:hypothetical protein [Sphingomonas aerolata]|uniref:hypothetical protein n=1 Tax=Sphingomonas aerolata TaxID=185951 RepID=UPI002FE08BED